MLNEPRPIDHGGWFLSGMIHEWTRELPGQRGYYRLKQFTGFAGAGVVGAETHGGEFDYLVFEARFGDKYGGPNNFQGMSGGGLWQMVYDERKEVLSVRDGLLSGVAFYQSVVSGGIDISCHGRRSVYKGVYDRLAHS